MLIGIVDLAVNGDFPVRKLFVYKRVADEFRDIVNFWPEFPG